MRPFGDLRIFRVDSRQRRVHVSLEPRQDLRRLPQIEITGDKQIAQQDEAVWRSVETTLTNDLRRLHNENCFEIFLASIVNLQLPVAYS